MENTRQNKIAKLLEHDLANIFQHIAQDEYKGTLISITKINVTSDLGIARINFSVFPTNKSQEVLDYFNENSPTIRGELGNKIKNQLRRVPELTYYLDDTLDYIDNIDKLLKGQGENPIK
jgi:ribosome-binding factor A